MRYGVVCMASTGTHRSVFLWPDDDTGPWNVVLHIGAVHGRLECIGIELLAYNPGDAFRDDQALPNDIDLDRAQPIRALTLRQFPLGAVVSEAIRAEIERRPLTLGMLADPDAMREAVESGNTFSLELSSDPDAWQAQFPDRWAKRREEAMAANRGRGGRRGHGPAHYADVATVYADAWAKGGHPTQAVSGHWTVAKATAAKWVARARELGFLEPTTKGRAGGVPTITDAAASPASDDTSAGTSTRTDEGEES